MSSTPATATAGSTISGITLTAEDAAGNTVTTYTGSHNIAWSGATTSPAGNAPSYPTTAVSFTSGTSTTTLTATLFAAGSNTITGSATSPTVTGTSGVINVAALAASHLAWTSESNSGGMLSGLCYFTCTYTSEGGSRPTFKSKISLTDQYGNPVVNSGSAITVTVSASGGGTFTGSAVVTIAHGASQSSSGGDGTVAGEITFTTQNGFWTTDTLSMTNTGSYTNASASFSR